MNAKRSRRADTLRSRRELATTIAGEAAQCTPHAAAELAPIAFSILNAGHTAGQARLLVAEAAELARNSYLSPAEALAAIQAEANQ